MIILSWNHLILELLQIQVTTIRKINLEEQINKLNREVLFK